MGHHRCMTTAWIDTHCHLDAPEFDADRNAVRQEATVQGVGHCVIPAVERSNWETVRLLAHQHGDSYALGIHPLYTGRADDGDVALLQEMLAQHHADPRLVAIGEIGLDYFVPGLDPTRQERFYRAQLQLARRFDLPVILHVRRSADKLLKGLRDLPVRGGIAHAFNGSLQQAQAFSGLGFKAPLALYPGRTAGRGPAPGAQCPGRVAAHCRGAGAAAWPAPGGTGPGHHGQRLRGTAPAGALAGVARH